jgi:hypothetical protein
MATLAATLLLCAGAATVLAGDLAAADGAADGGTGGALPPAGTPPATTAPPAGTPPAGTPPATLSPAGTPPPGAPAAGARARPARPRSAQEEAGEPRAQTSTPPTAARRPPQSADHVDLDTTTVTGNREQPKVMYVVPWKKSDMGDGIARPMNSLLDEVLAPVDRDVFRREVSYYQALQADAAGGGGAPQGGGAAPPAGQVEK